MAAPLRSRSTPSGKRSHLKVSRKPSAVPCALCKATLNAIPRLGTSDLRKLPLTKKRPERTYGGVLCADCVRTLLKERVRLAAGLLTEADVDFRHLPYLRSMKGRAEKKSAKK